MTQRIFNILINTYNFLHKVWSMAMLTNILITIHTKIAKTLMGLLSVKNSDFSVEVILKMGIFPVGGLLL